MLRFEMKHIDDSKVDYTYYVEGDRTDVGVVSLNVATGDFDVLQQAKGDRRGRYAMHLISRMREFLSSGSFAKAGTVAWY